MVVNYNYLQLLRTNVLRLPLEINGVNCRQPSSPISFLLISTLVIFILSLNAKDNNEHALTLKLHPATLSIERHVPLFLKRMKADTAM